MGFVQPWKRDLSFMSCTSLYIIIHNDIRVLRLIEA